MKLWLVLYAGQQIGGTWGPLPYDMDECLSRAAERQQSVTDTIEKGVDPDGEKIPADVIEKFKTWRIVCEYHDERPELGSE